jgi:hypothetical protein
MRPIDYHQADERLFKDADPIRCQLLGQISNDRFKYYVPEDSMVPLKIDAVQGGTFMTRSPFVLEPGLVDWTQKMLGNKKERLLIYAIGLDRLIL